MKTKYGLIGIGIAIGLFFVLAAWIMAERNYQYQGALIEPPVPAADFTLADQNGESFQLSSQAKNIVLIFFGYTHCPDVCPVTLSEFRQIKEQLGSQAENVKFVFVTVDPERDTAEQIKTYLNNFIPEISGLSGSRSELELVWRNFGVYQEKGAKDSQGDYLVDHTSRIYLVDQAGNWRLTYTFGTEASKIAADIRHLLRTMRQQSTLPGDGRRTMGD